MKISNSLFMWIQLKLGQLKEYAKLSEDLLKDKQENFDSWAVEQASKLSEEQKEEFYDFYSDDHWELSEVYPNILRQSLFVACVSLIEHELISLCKHLYKENKYCLQLDDIVGKGIYKAKLYLNKVADLGKNTIWEDILVFQKIRNFIVHNSGKIDGSKNSQEVQRYISSKSSITLDDFKQMQFSCTFCFEVIEAIEKFFDSLFKELKK